MPNRRTLIASAAALVVVGAGAAYYRFGRASESAATPAPPPGAPPAGPTLPPSDPRVTERVLGRSDAPVTVHEYFSLTCPHCAAFARESLPAIKTGLIDTGRIRYVLHDFPLDKVALQAAMVARTLPAERYEPFVSALLASQDRWAFARNVNSTEELAKMAALAGLSRPGFDAAIADLALRNTLIAMQDSASANAHVDATPFFVFAGPHGTTSESGEKSYQEFAALVAKVA